MSVLACSRSNCPNIMCDKLILNHTHYICNDCFDELTRWKYQLLSNSQPPVKVDEIRGLISSFLNSKVGSTITNNSEATEEDFDRVIDVNYNDR